MSFHLTSDKSTLKVKDNHILRGRIKDKDGKLTDGSIDLNRFLGNKNGRQLPPLFYFQEPKKGLLYTDIHQAAFSGVV